MEYTAPNYAYKGGIQHAEHHEDQSGDRTDFHQFALACPGTYPLFVDIQGEERGDGVQEGGNGGHHRSQNADENESTYTGGDEFANENGKNIVNRLISQVEPWIQASH